MDKTERNVNDVSAPRPKKLVDRASVAAKGRAVIHLEGAEAPTIFDIRLILSA